MRISTVILDLDDTLINTKLVAELTRKAIFDEIGVPLSKHHHMAALWKRLLWYFHEDDYAGILQALVYESKDWFVTSDKQIKQAVQIGLSSNNLNIPVNDDILVSLKWLIKHNIKCGIATNGNLEYQTKKYYQAKLDQYIPSNFLFIGTQGLPTGKPNPKMLLDCCESMQAEPANCIYIGDRTTDIIAANLANMASILLLDQHGSDWKVPTDIGCLKLEIPSYEVSIHNLHNLLKNIIVIM